MDVKLKDYRDKKLYYDSLCTSMKEIEKKAGKAIGIETDNRLDALLKERELIEKELKAIEEDLINRCKVLPHIERAMIVDKFINGLSNKKLAEKYSYSYGAMRNKVGKILKRIGLK